MALGYHGTAGRLEPCELHVLDDADSVDMQGATGVLLEAYFDPFVVDVPGSWTAPTREKVMLLDQLRFIVSRQNP